MEKIKENMKWFFSEILNLYSSKPSFFSKKRIESGISFILGQIFMIAYFITHFDTMEVSGMVAFVGVEFAIAGWNIHQIQKEKKEFLFNEEDSQSIQVPIQEPTPPLNTSDIITEINEESQD